MWARSILSSIQCPTRSSPASATFARADRLSAPDHSSLDSLLEGDGFEPSVPRHNKFCGWLPSLSYWLSLGAPRWQPGRDSRPTPLIRAITNAVGTSSPEAARKRGASGDDRRPTRCRPGAGQRASSSAGGAFCSGAGRCLGFSAPFTSPAAVGPPVSRQAISLRQSRRRRAG